jgi:hypothetical protein
MMKTVKIQARVPFPETLPLIEVPVVKLVGKYIAIHRCVRALNPTEFYRGVYIATHIPTGFSLNGLCRNMNKAEAIEFARRFDAFAGDKLNFTKPEGARELGPIYVSIRDAMGVRRS